MKQKLFDFVRRRMFETEFSSSKMICNEISECRRMAK